MQGKYLIVIYDETEIEAHGPYTTHEARNIEAAQIANRYGQGTKTFWLDADEDHDPEAGLISHLWLEAD